MAAETEVRIYTDGGSRGNPGPAAIGIVVCDGQDRVLRRHREYIGEATNNEAEYRAVIRGLGLAARYRRGRAVVTCDSELVVKQLNGRYRIRDLRMAGLAQAVRQQERAFTMVDYRNRPRMEGHLALADSLVNEALDRLPARRRSPLRRNR